MTQLRLNLRTLLWHHVDLRVHDYVDWAPFKVVLERMNNMPTKLAQDSLELNIRQI